MKVCLFLESDMFFKKSGIGVALQRQKTALDTVGVSYTTNPKGDYDIIHVNTILPKSLMIAKIAKKNGKKLILHAHTLEEDTKNSFTGSNTIAPLFKKYLQHYYALADHIICPSNYAKRKLREYGLTQPITVVTNGVDLNKFQFDSQKREAYRKRYSLQGTVPFSVGHVFMRKGVTSFINVAKNFDNQFVWFGNVFSNAIVRNFELQKALNQKTENIRFTGYIDDIVAAYSAGDIFFFPSMAETQGIVILEAWGIGKPVLIRDLHVYDGWTTHGKDCLRAKDDKEFAEYLQMLIDDESLRKKLVSGGQKTAKKHSMSEVGKKLKSVYEEVLNEG